jgi:hypothetical protein
MSDPAPHFRILNRSKRFIRSGNYVYHMHLRLKLLGIISVGFDVTDQLLIRFLHSSDTGEKNGSTMRQYIGYS